LGTQGSQFWRNIGRTYIPRLVAKLASAAATAAENKEECATTNSPTALPVKQYCNLMDVVCYKCSDKGYFANSCSKGCLAFLIQPAKQEQILLCPFEPTIQRPLCINCVYANLDKPSGLKRVIILFGPILGMNGVSYIILRSKD